MLAYDAQTAAVHTAIFDGPMELLLFLVRREGVDIREVRIAPIADAFLAQIELMETLDLDVAADFLVMAATLCYLKSRELLPREPLLVNEEDDPNAIREDLARRLQEYERYREASESLCKRDLLDRDVWAPMSEPPTGGERPVSSGMNALGLLEVFYEVLRRHKTPPPIHSVQRETYSIRDMAERVLALVDGGASDVSSVLACFADRMDRVVAFLAVLELARLFTLDITQDDHLGPVRLVVRPDADRAALERLTVEGV